MLRPACFDCRRATFPLEDRMYILKFMMNLSTYLMKRVPRYPQVSMNTNQIYMSHDHQLSVQIYLYGHPGLGKSTFINTCLQVQLQGREFGVTKVNSKSFQLGMLTDLIPGAYGLRTSAGMNLRPRNYLTF